MAKLKPIADEKELAAVPLDEPVLVELEPAIAGAENDDEPEPKPALKVVEQDEPTDGAAKLEKQLRASEDARERERERAEKAERDAAEARQEAARLRTTTADTEKELLNNSLASAQAAQVAAKAAFKVAFDAGDPEAMAEANAQIARAATDIRNYEGAVAQFDNDTQTAEREPVRQEQNQDTSIEAAIDRDPKLLGPERDWLKSHTEVLTDPKVNRKLGVAYDEALEKGLRRGTPAYFEFLDDRLGYAEANTSGDNRTEERASIMAAPVSRDNRSSTTGQRLSSSQVKLTPQQREMAVLMGISDTEYARGFQQMEADRIANPEKYAQR